jgi:hypothetical protein
MLHLVTGYRRTGKDTFCLKCQQSQKHYMEVYSTSSDVGEGKVLVPVGGKRVSFADKLKEEVNTLYKIDPDCDKDQLTLIDGLLQAPRDLYIKHAKLELDLNPYHWVEAVVPEITLLLNQGCSVIITDWRYPHEYQCLRKLFYGLIVTWRIYRSEVAVPSEDVISEHQLDQSTTNYLIVRDSEEFTNALKVFPQYQGSALIGSI